MEALEVVEGSGTWVLLLGSILCMACNMIDSWAWGTALATGSRGDLFNKP